MVARDHVQLLGAQVVGGLAITAVVVIPVLVLGEAGVAVARIALAFIALVGYGAARMMPLSLQCSTRVLIHRTSSATSITAAT